MTRALLRLLRASALRRYEGHTSLLVRLACHTKLFAKYGGDDRIRTDDLPLAKRALYQLSYIPVFSLRRVALGGPKSTRTTDLPVISGVL